MRPVASILTFWRPWCTPSVHQSRNFGWVGLGAAGGFDFVEV